MASQFPIPEPTTTCQVIPKEQLLRQYQILGDVLNAGTLLIDVRRTDYEGGTIRGSLNMPAQSFPYNMSTLFRLCQGDGLSVISRVVFYCGKFVSTVCDYIPTLVQDLPTVEDLDVPDGLQSTLQLVVQNLVFLSALMFSSWKAVSKVGSQEVNNTQSTWMLISQTIGDNWLIPSLDKAMELVVNE
jgi:hypothetical protein